MRKRVRQIQEQVIARAGETFTSAIRAAMNPEKAAADAQRVRDEYHGLPSDALADVLIRRAARKTKWEGAASGLGVTACEALLAAPAPEPTHKLAAGSGVAALLLGDIAYTTRLQMQLLLAIADLYGCPFERDDEEDVYTVFKTALGLKGTERVGSYSRFIFTETARKQFRRLLHTGIRRVVQDRVVKIAGPRIGAYLGEKSLMRLVPVANAAIGYAFNNSVTKSVGRWAKVKAKVRASAFQHMRQIEDQEPAALVWILPLIFHVGTADDKLTENFLTLYSQINKRLRLDQRQQRQVEWLIASDQLLQIFTEALPQIATKRTRNALYDIAITTAAVNLEVRTSLEECLAQLAKCLRLDYSRADLKDKIQYLRR
jgi:hypothetical protein